MKYYLYDTKGNPIKQLSDAKLRELLTDNQIVEGNREKFDDPLEEVSFLTSNGIVVFEI